ncbi:MAG TPA: ankyrin repeat domain-containing protein [Methanosarcina sp.]|nr:ankyrin repeat domain-containing protein [Methanosarcina sp.]
MENGANPNVQEGLESGTLDGGLIKSAGATPLLVMQNIQIAKLSLEHGADPNLSAADSPLGMAAGRGSYEMCELLIHYGADKALKSARGHTAYDIAMKYHADKKGLLDLLSCSL